MIVVAVACAAAGIVVGIIPMGPSDVITTLINNGALDNVFLLLILTAITSLLIGMGLPTTATLYRSGGSDCPANRYGFESNTGHGMAK